MVSVAIDEDSELNEVAFQHLRIRYLRDIWLPLSILALGVVLLQYHSIRYWQSLVGAWTGVGWSILLELISLWLWFNTGDRPGVPKRYVSWASLRLLALVTTVLLLAGPLYQISLPTLQDWRGILDAAQKIQLLQEEITDDQAGLVAYRKNSRTRLGWLEKINQMESGLREHRKRMLALFDASGQTFSWERWATVSLQALSLVLFQIANILAISTLSRRFHLSETIPSPLPKERGNVFLRNFQQRPNHVVVPDPYQNNIGKSPLKHTEGSSGGENHLIARLQHTIKARLDYEGISQAEFCRRHSIHPRDLSLLFNYFRLKAAGKRNVPEVLITKLAHRFLPRAGKGA